MAQIKELESFNNELRVMCRKVHMYCVQKCEVRLLYGGIFTLKTAQISVPSNDSDFKQCVLWCVCVCCDVMVCRFVGRSLHQVGPTP